MSRLVKALFSNSSKTRPAFPILKLALLAQLEILKHLDFEELVILSMTSKKCKELVKEAKFRLKTLEWGLYDNEKTDWLTLNDVLFIGFPAPSKQNKKEYKGLRRRCIQQIHLNGSLPLVRRDNQPMTIGNPTLDDYDHVRNMDRLTEHLFDVFNTTHTVFSLAHWSAAPLADCFVVQKKYTTTFDTLGLAQTSGDDLRLVFEELTIKTLELLGPIDADYRLAGDLKVEILKAEDPNSWLTLDALLGMQCRRVHLGTLPKRHLNALLKHWLAGGLPDLECFEAIPEENDVLDGIPTFLFTPDNRPRHWDGQDVLDGKDMRRDDGTLASVVVNGGRFKFYVWHSKFLSGQGL